MATELGKAYVQIVPSAQGISGSISNVLQGESVSAGRNSGTKIAGALKKAIAAAGIGLALKKTLDIGGALEQSLGGLDTIYGDAAGAAKEYAKQAYKAGISQNSYAEQAVSFGAALKQAYGGDTKKAINAADKAIMDMTDNAAKMGTPLESIQAAYQGFAKQNYTMLDNLKLGYGGTKSEMERLLKDATKLSGVEYNIDNLGDVYDAIHVIQGDLGLTGVAAKEASETFTGSFGAMKAAAENLLGSLMLGQDVGPAMQALVKSASTFLFKNLLPAVGRVFLSLPEAIKSAVQTAAPLIASNIGNLIQTAIDKGPELLAAAKKAVIKIANGLQRNLPQLATKAGQMIGTLAQGLIKNLPKIGATVLKIGAFLLKKLGQMALTLVKSGLAIVKNIAKGITSGIGSLIGSAMTKVKNAITAPITKAKELVTSAINKIKNLFPLKLGKIFSGIKMPHFKISGGKAPWGIAGKGERPRIGIEWKAQGGIMRKPVLFGGGEAGDEAIVPLTPFWQQMNDMADSIVGGVGTVMAGASGYGGDIQLDVYLYPSGPKMMEQTVKMYDTGKRRGMK